MSLSLMNRHEQRGREGRGEERRGEERRGGKRRGEEVGRYVVRKGGRGSEGY